MNKTILFVSHKKSQCGVYVPSLYITDAIRHSKKYNFVRVECGSLDELKKAVVTYSPSAIIYNYMPILFPFMADGTYRLDPVFTGITQIGIIHDVSLGIAEGVKAYKDGFVPGVSSTITSMFDYYIALDPTIGVVSPIAQGIGRLIPTYQNNFPEPDKLTVGSYGFGTPGKGFERLVPLVESEFDEAIIRINIPASTFCDPDGTQAKAIATQCHAQVTKPGIQLITTHNYWSGAELLDFLAQSTVNVFLYEDMGVRGISSVLDMAMAVRRPIAISDSVMFRHVLDIEPSICVLNNISGAGSHRGLREIINNGFVPLENRYEQWNTKNYIRSYEEIVDVALTTRGGNMNTTKKYKPVKIPKGVSLNRILDNGARELYKPAVDKLFQLVPDMMARKIPEANVQHGFVLDTVCRHTKTRKAPKILCVGSFEDTTSAGLIAMGYEIEEIDTAINCSLQEHFMKPTTLKGSYDIIFSTSVIEHVKWDGVFVAHIGALLTPGGIAILTCDFKEGWEPGDSKPGVDKKLYTQHDLKESLLPLMGDCVLVDEPQWDCPNPDFVLIGLYRYTFATFVVRRTKPGGKK